MIATIEHNGKTGKVNLAEPIDLALAIQNGKGASAWYAGHPRIFPVINRHFTGSVRLGGSVNFNDVQFNPHAHGTHTESLGHISREEYPLDSCLKNYFFLAHLISLEPEQRGNDRIISRDQLKQALDGVKVEALIIRSLPNDRSKMEKMYSNTNPAFMEADGMTFLREAGIRHLLLDLPSVDREEDGGVLAGHHAFWNMKAHQLLDDSRLDCTITELIFVPDAVVDGPYLLELQVASFSNDASPSRPVLYRWM